MMKKAFSKIGEFFFMIFIGISIIIIFIGMILCTPIDFIRYRLSPYYKDTKEKYQWNDPFLNPYFKLYNLIKKENLPIEFYRDKENQASCFGYFVYNNALILPDYGFGYDEDEEKWFCDDYDEDAHPDANDCTEIDICKDIIDEEIKRCNELCGENTCNYVYALVDYNDIPENAPTDFEHFSFIQVKNEDYKSALKAIVNYER